MIALDPVKLRRLLASARLLESNKDGERLAALEVVKRLLPDGTRIADLLEKALLPESPLASLRGGATDLRSGVASSQHWLSPWRRTAKRILTSDIQLTEREYEFVMAMSARTIEPTYKQSGWLDDLASRLRYAA